MVDACGTTYVGGPSPHSIPLGRLRVVFAQPAIRAFILEMESSLGEDGVGQQQLQTSLNMRTDTPGPMKIQPRRPSQRLTTR